jgi:hypothetical protein
MMGPNLTALQTGIENLKMISKLDCRFFLEHPRSFILLVKILLFSFYLSHTQQNQSIKFTEITGRSTIITTQPTENQLNRNSPAIYELLGKSELGVRR